MDVFTKKKRSEIMSRIRSKNTKAELLVFRELRRRGVYFQKHYSRAVGKPDIALPRKKIAVFIDGNFWHGYRFFKNKHRLPKKYWVKKIESNIARDRKNRAKLRRMGWKVMKVWESDLTGKRKASESLEKIILFLTGSLK